MIVCSVEIELDSVWGRSHVCAVNTVQTENDVLKRVAMFMFLVQGEK